MQRVVFLIAPPGSGKGTQAKLLQVAGFSVLEMSAVLRKRVTSTEKTIGGGGLVDCFVVIEALKGHLEEVPLDHDVVFDGFPRTKAQGIFAVEHFKKTHRDPTFVIIELSDEGCRKRVAGRREQAILLGIPPRKEDKEEVHEKRLKIYRKEIGPLQNYLHHNAQKSVHLVNGGLSIESTATVIQEITSGILV